MPADSGAALAVPAILVVDDNPVKRVALRAMLTPLGYALVDAESGRAALAALETQTFALILMDVRMPTLDGFETARLCRQQRRGARTPIIFITALGGDEGEVASAYASGAVDFIFTPVVPDVLRSKVKAFVALYLQAAALQRSVESVTLLNAALRDSDIRTQAVLDNVADAIFILDEAGVIDSINRSVAGMFGYLEGEPLGHPFAFMIAPECRDELRGLDSVLTRAKGAPPLSIETLGRRTDGGTFAVELECSEMEHDERTFTLVCVRDISERRAHTDELEHLALHDGLTGLANRTLFGHLLATSLALGRRANEPRAVLMLDLDGFKNINDTLGHDRGDSLLKQVGERLVETLRESDTVARLGGDEFAILLGDATDLDAAVAVALKVEQICELPFTASGETMHVSPSVGVAIFPEHGGTSAELLHRADLAMYSAKRAGNGHAVFHAAHEPKAAERLSLLRDLGHCVSREELVLYYQPKIALATGAVTGVEALLRWQHPSLGLLAPGQFMPEVERTHLISAVTRWVLDTALRQQRSWRDQGVDLTIAVNISARSLRAASTLPEVVAALTEVSDTAPGRLTLELTESALIGEAAHPILNTLHEMRHMLSIDDFGTGYSSLAYLQRLPVDEIKIDRSFILNMATAVEDAIIVHSTIELAHNLGLRVVAEGVEDAGAASILAEHGCDEAQGFHYARPAPAEELWGLLAGSCAAGVAAAVKTAEAPRQGELVAAAMSPAPRLGSR
jgi:diguanylate cyclase (GGDEF)-like protein/PAS domain S-box-containing protein